MDAKLFMAVPMTSSVAVADFSGRRYCRFFPFNFLLSLAAPHLHGVLVLVPGDKFITGVIVTADNWSPVSTINLSPVSTTPAITEINFSPNSFSPVSLTPLININSRISPRIFEKIQNGLNGILWGLGALIHGKKLRSKTRVRLPVILSHACYLHNMVHATNLFHPFCLILHVFCIQYGYKDQKSCVDRHKSRKSCVDRHNTQISCVDRHGSNK
jgi:hypothetical protein